MDYNNFIIIIFQLKFKIYARVCVYIYYEKQKQKRKIDR